MAMTTITAWRITPKKYQNTAFTGEGANEYGGRFNSVGTAVVYTSDSLALATLELLTKVNERRRLRDRVCIPVTFQETHIQTLDVAELPDGWDNRPYGPASQRVGDEWVHSDGSLVLRVPSVVLPHAYNYLINPKHPDAEDLTVGHPEPLDLDPRIYRT